MARHGENIRKRGDGRWEARYRIFDAVRGRQIYRSVYASTYEDVKKKREDIMRTKEESSDHGMARMSETGTRTGIQIRFSQAAVGWLEEVAGKRKYSTYIKYRNVYRVHLEGLLGPCLLSDIAYQELPDRLNDHVSAQNLSDSMRRSIYGITSQILAFANVKYAVCIPVLKPAATGTVKKMAETLSKAEQLRLFTCIYKKPDRCRIAILLCLYTGMRLGELSALKWTDFDFEDRTVTISRTVQRIVAKDHFSGTVLMESAPKSEYSRRTVPLTDEIAKPLADLMGNGIYVFGGDRPLEPRTMQYRFKRLLKEAGIDDRNFHILRHTFATNCVESGMDVKTLSMLLGHSDVKITLNRYVHPTMDSRRRQIERLPDFYGQIHGQADRKNIVFPETGEDFRRI